MVNGRKRIVRSYYNDGFYQELKKIQKNLETMKKRSTFSDAQKVATAKLQKPGSFVTEREIERILSE